MHDAIILGGGPAGLQAALTLGRMHRRTLLLDSGEYRNASVAHAHNAITNDGRPPAEIRSLARRELTAYADVEVRTARATAVTRTDEGFTVHIDGADLPARTVILATGLVDDLPAIPGIAEAWGAEVAQCPFCHGHEFAGRRIGILGEAPHAEMQAGMLRPIGSEVVILPPADVERVERIGTGLRVHRTTEAPVEVAGLFIAAVARQRAPFAEQLGLEVHAGSGCIVIDPLGRTSVDGVYAAGDAAHTSAMPGPLASIVAATAAGQLAAVAVVQRFVAAAAERGGNEA